MHLEINEKISKEANGTAFVVSSLNEKTILDCCKIMIKIFKMVLNCSVKASVFENCEKKR